MDIYYILSLGIGGNIMATYQKYQRQDESNIYKPKANYHMPTTKYSLEQELKQIEEEIEHLQNQRKLIRSQLNSFTGDKYVK